MRGTKYIFLPCFALETTNYAFSPELFVLRGITGKSRQNYSSPFVREVSIGQLPENKTILFSDAFTRFVSGYSVARTHCYLRLDFRSYHSFTCRSVMFYYKTKVCLLNSGDRSSATLSRDTEGHQVDYFENHIGGCKLPPQARFRNSATLLPHMSLFPVAMLRTRFICLFSALSLSFPASRFHATVDILVVICILYCFHCTLQHQVGSRMMYYMLLSLGQSSFPCWYNQGACSPPFRLPC